MARGRWGYAMAMAIQMKNNRDLQYPNRSVRLADKTWQLFKHLRKKSGKSCNLFMKELLEKKSVQKQNS